MTSSDNDPVVGKLDLVTDGQKEGTEGSWVERWSSEDPRYGGSGTPESDVRGPWTLAAHSALFLGLP